MKQYKTISYNDLIIQGLKIERKIAEIEEPKEDTISESMILFCTTIFDDIFSESMRSILIPYIEQGEEIPVISKLEFIGQIGNMQNVIREETTTGLVNYYSYIDDENYYILNENDALENKIALWKLMSGNLTKVYEQFQKQGLDKSSSNMTLNLNKKR